MPHLEAIFRAAVAICGSQQAEDMTQATYVKALQRFDTFQRGSNCKAWLLSILRNTWIDWLRRRKVIGPEAHIEDIPVAAAPEAIETTWSNAKDLLENFSDSQIIRTLGQLPDEQRLTIYLIDVEELSYSKVAEIMAVPLGTVKSRTSHARRFLKDKLEAYAQERGLSGREPHASK